MLITLIHRFLIRDRNIAALTFDKPDVLVNFNYSDASKVLKRQIKVYFCN